MNRLYDFEIDKIIAEIDKKKAKKVLLQLPDGLRPYAFQLAETIKKVKKIEIIFSGDSCYGACDLAIRQANELNVDLLIHYGHSLMVETEFPVLYISAKIDIPITNLVEAIVPNIKGWNKIGLVTTIQHIHQLKDFAEAMNNKGLKTVVGKGDNLSIYDGQILGCNFLVTKNLSEHVDGFIFIGGGKFHPLGLAISTGKPILIANPYNSKISFLDDSEIMSLAKKRMAAITLTKNAKNVGILVCSKPGQKSLGVAEEFMEKLDKKEINAFIIYLDEVRPETLNNFSEADAFIDTACPRIAIDGIVGVEKPIVTIQEMRVVLGELAWEKIWGQNYFSF